jgi:hypothetical protein
MVKIDHEELARENVKKHENFMKERDKMISLAKKHEYDLKQEGLKLSVLSRGNADFIYGFKGILPRQRCFFDSARLDRVIGAVFGGGDGFPHTYYRCPKCKIFYDLTLSERERKEYREGQRKDIPYCCEG